MRLFLRFKSLESLTYYARTASKTEFESQLVHKRSAKNAILPRKDVCRSICATKMLHTNLLKALKCVLGLSISVFEKKNWKMAENLRFNFAPMKMKQKCSRIGFKNISFFYTTFLQYFESFSRPFINFFYVHIKLFYTKKFPTHLI